MTPTEQDPAEVAAHAILGLAGAHPGRFGRLRTARVVAGYAVPLDDTPTAEAIAPYTAAVSGWSLRDAVTLVDALLTGELLAQTVGQRPTLALTRAGHRALDALDQPPTHESHATREPAGASA